MKKKNFKIEKEGSKKQRYAKKLKEALSKARKEHITPIVAPMVALPETLLMSGVAYAQNDTSTLFPSLLLTGTLVAYSIYLYNHDESKKRRNTIRKLKEKRNALLASIKQSVPTNNKIKSKF